MIELVVFDLDGTLAESKSSLDEEMAALLVALLDVVPVAVISGGDWPQFQRQLLGNLPDAARLDDLLLLPTCGTKFYRHHDGWELLYSDDLSAKEKSAIISALNVAAAQPGLETERTWGEVIEDRGSQITFSALGQDAPIEAKKGWDPDFAKRQRMKSTLDRIIPGFSIRLGGTTSVDVTKPGIDKAYGLGRLREVLHVELSGMLFVGDAIFPGGNDYPAKEAGVACVNVRDPDETKRVIETVIACAAGVRSSAPAA